MTEPKREPAFAAVGLVLALVGLVGSFTAFFAGGWWLLLLIVGIPMFALGTYGFMDSLERKPRDE